MQLRSLPSAALLALAFVLAPPAVADDPAEEPVAEVEAVAPPADEAPSPAGAEEVAEEAAAEPAAAPVVTTARDLDAAGTSYGDVTSQSPQAPLTQSAQELRRQLGGLPEPARRWQLELLGGMEYDSEPRILGDESNEIPLPGGSADGRGVIRLSGLYRLVDAERGDLTAGFDGYWSLQLDETEFDLQTYNPWIAGGVNLGPARLALRYDYAYSVIDGDESFRHLHRVTPSVAIRQGEWGATTLFYRFDRQRYPFDTPSPGIFDRDGHRHVVGANQLFFLPMPFRYVRIGGGADWQRSDGTEFDYDGLQANFGAGYDFDYGITFGWLYRFAYRHFQQQSVFSSPRRKRDDFRHVLTVDIGKSLGEHWRLSLGGAFTWNDSDVPVYTYDRQVAGAYASYTF